ncbi:hypothetical protein R6Z07F_004163 [Ovis aries]
MRRQKVQRGLRGQFPRPSAQQQAATEPNQAANSSMLRGRSSGSRSPPAPIGRLRERSATAKYHRPASLHSAPSMAEVPRYFPVLPGIPHAATASRKQKGVNIGLKMQAALEITARYCGRELEQYGQCVAAKPESWQRDCHHLKMSIAQCTSAQSARPVRSLSRPLRNVFDRMKPLWATVRSMCADSCSVQSRCSQHTDPPPWRHTHFLPPEDPSDCRKTGRE